MNAIRVTSEGGVCRIELARPALRNAMNDDLIDELTATFAQLPAGTRVVVLEGQGQAFCAGADLAWMQKSAVYTEAENAREARELSRLFETIDQAPVVVIGRVHGVALGGGAGLAACCDIVVAEKGTRFGFPEVRLGLVPAVISPFVVRRIGPASARRYFVTGEMFDADEARRIGLADEVVSAEAARGAVDGLVAAVLRSGPHAVSTAKRLVRTVVYRDGAEVHDFAAETIAALRVHPEAQEGMLAFLEKRAPRWS